MLGLQSQQVEHLPGTDQAYFIHHYDAAIVQLQAAHLCSLEENRERCPIARLNTGASQILGLSPSERCAVALPLVCIPGIDQGRQQRGFAGACHADGNAEPSTSAEPVDDGPLSLAVLTGKAQA